MVSVKCVPSISCVFSKFLCQVEAILFVVSVYSVYALACCAPIRLLLATIFSLSWIFPRASIEIHSSCRCFLQLSTSYDVEVSASLIIFHLFSIVVSSSLSKSFEAYKLLLRSILNSLCLSACWKKGCIKLLYCYSFSASSAWVSS